MKRKLVFVFGTRPEAIKLAPVILEAKEYKKQLITKVLATAQHRELMDDVLTTFGIRPDHDLNIMSANQSLSSVTTKILLGIEKILVREKPDWIIVQGDTNTVLASVLASYYHKIKLAHVEAGLRSFDKYQPFPEEINRVVTSHVCDFNFTPTAGARKNLLAEGIPKNKILITGNTAIDALFLALKNKFKKNRELDKIDFSKKIILVTSHRRENFGRPLANICKALMDLSKTEKIEIVYPVHPNPNVRKIVYKYLKPRSNIKIIEPLDYCSFCYLMKKSYLILTDSGGIQEEAPSLHKPIIILRNVTERPEIVKCGGAILAGTSYQKILYSTETLLNNKKLYQRMASVINPFGDGKASNRIIKWILQH